MRLKTKMEKVQIELAYDLVRNIYSQKELDQVVEFVFNKITDQIGKEKYFLKPYVKEALSKIAFEPGNGEYLH